MNYVSIFFFSNRNDVLLGSWFLEINEKTTEADVENTINSILDIYYNDQNTELIVYLEEKNREFLMPIFKKYGIKHIVTKLE